MNADTNQSTNVIFITEEEHRVEWTPEATKELLKYYDEKVDMQETGIISTQKKLWELVSKDLSKKGFFYTAAQCENKWKALKRSYRNKMERMEKMGICKKPCPFEYEITEILSKRSQESLIKPYYPPAIKKLKSEPEIFNVNLNNPPGFSSDEVDNSPEDIKHSKFIEEDENLVEQLLQDGNQEILIQETSSQSQIIDELSELRKVISKHNRIHSQILKQSVDMQSKLLQYFDGAAQRECQSLELEETRMEQQNEVIKQMKIQNGLLQKLLEKL